MMKLECSFVHLIDYVKEWRNLTDHDMVRRVKDGETRENLGMSASLVNSYCTTVAAD